MHPFDPVNFCIPKVKPWWWDEKSYCKFHNGIGHNVENCGKLKHIIHDIIENGKLQVDGLNNNSDHMAFKEPFPKYNKGETSKSKNGKDEMNYTYMNAKNVTNILEVVEENVNIMRHKDPYGYNLDMEYPPIFNEKPIPL